MLRRASPRLGHATFDSIWTLVRRCWRDCPAWEAYREDANQSLVSWAPVCQENATAFAASRSEYRIYKNAACRKFCIFVRFAGCSGRPEMPPDGAIIERCLATSKAADTHETLVGSDARCCHGEFGRGPTAQGDGDNIELLPNDL